MTSVQKPIGAGTPMERDPKFIGYLDDAKKIKVYRTEHYIWKERNQLKKKAMLAHGTNRPSDLRLKAYLEYIPQTMGRWHYFYQNDRGQKISLVNTIRGLPGKGSKRVKMSTAFYGLMGGMPSHWYQTFYWEICSGGSCEGCMDADELFSTRKQAEVRILELLK